MFLFIYIYIFIYTQYVCIHIRTYDATYIYIYVVCHSIFNPLPGHSIPWPWLNAPRNHSAHRCRNERWKESDCLGQEANGGKGQETQGWELPTNIYIRLYTYIIYIYILYIYEKTRKDQRTRAVVILVVWILWGNLFQNLENSAKKLADRQKNKGVKGTHRTKSQTFAVFSTRDSHVFTAYSEMFMQWITEMLCQVFKYLQIHRKVAKLKQQVKNKRFQMWQQSSAPTGDVTMFMLMKSSCMWTSAAQTISPCIGV